MVLDANSLDAIEQEVRNCFLFEDVPEYLSTLERDLQLLNADDKTIDRAEVYKSLMRTTHSLKGGAGIAQLPHLSGLSHKLEDLCIAVQQGKVADLSIANDLLTYSFEHISQLIGAAIRGGTEEEAQTAAKMSIFQELDLVLQEIALSNSQATEASSDISAPNLSFLKTVLEVDLEDCLQRVEAVFSSPEIGDSEIKEILGQFIEECTLLGETLGQNWLSEAVKPICSIIQQPIYQIIPLVTEIIITIREQRDIVFSGKRSSDSSQPVTVEESAIVDADDLLSPLLSLSAATDTVEGSNAEDILSPLFEGTTADLEEIGEGVIDNTSIFFVGEEIAKAEVNPNAEAQIAQNIAKKVDRPVNKSINPNIPELKLRMPVSRLNRINNNLGELYVNQERFTLFQQQIVQVNQSLKKRADQFRPINDRIQQIYDRLATENVKVGRGSDSGKQRDNQEEFDVLELDRYNELHESLQSLQELMVRVQESRFDIDAISNEFQSALDDLRLQLNSLRSDLTESRFEPFRILTDRLALPLPSLNQQYRKNVKLKIEGEYTPIDRLILEQLETPLTHIFRNAFDHGIETTEERTLLSKPDIATITVSAAIKSNQVVIKIVDDGRGINLDRVYKKAVQLGLTDLKFSELTQDRILDFMFMPGFSTASSVTELSGRGVGLDIVRLQLERLQGSIAIKTELGVGTQFILNIPLSLSILPLLLCRSQNRTFAFPSNEVIETIQILRGEEEGKVIWKEQSLPCYPLGQVLPYSQATGVKTEPTLALIVKVEDRYVALGIDSLLTEKELTVKPFDRTIRVPSYLLGCTVLGTGEIVPVLNSDRLGSILPLSPLDPPLVFAPPTVEETCILIVDDSISVRRMLDKCLSQSGYQVVQCRDGKEAVAMLAQDDRQFHLIISDVEMPRLDGFELLLEIRSQKKWKNVPVAMLTSRDNEIHRQKASALGATAYFTKPFQPQQIIDNVAKLLAMASIPK